MSVRLTVTQRSEAGGASGKEVVLDDPIITLGRDKTCQVVLPQQAVSRNHARISQEGTLYFLEDLGSAYGTKVNGKALPQGEKELLRNGDIIAIAQFDVRFDKVVEVQQDVSDKTSFLARGKLKDVLRGSDERFLRYMNGPREGQRIEISDAQEHVFGRDEKEADVILKDDLVSRRHAKVRRDWSGTHVEDLGSRNGIKVNKKRVNRKALKDGDELEIGATRFVYVDPAEPPDEQPVSLSTDADPISAPAPSPPRPSPPRREEPPPPAPEPEPEPEPAPAPPDEASASSEDPSASSEEPPPDESQGESMPEPDGGGAMEGLADKKKFVPLIVMGVVGLTFLALIIAVLAGA